MKKIEEYYAPWVKGIPMYISDHIELAWRKPELHRMMSNENPLPPSEKVLEAMFKYAKMTNRYPDQGLVVRSKIAEINGVAGPQNVMIGTAVFAGDAWVRFGILHQAGLAMVLVIPFVKVPAGWNAAIGASLFALGLWLNTLSTPTPWLLPVGVPQAGVAMLDYYPLLPWFVLVLAGLAAVRTLYPGGGARFRIPDLSGSPVTRGLGWLGRHSLAVYLIHQPVLIGLLLAARGAGVV